jgi:hypothetical protein
MPENNGKQPKNVSVKKQLDYFQALVKEDGKGADAFLATIHTLKEGKILHRIEISAGFHPEDFQVVTDAIDEAIEGNMKRSASGKSRSEA